MEVGFINSIRIRNKNSYAIFLQEQINFLDLVNESRLKLKKPEPVIIPNV
jgi:hypothetical protein